MSEPIVQPVDDPDEQTAAKDYWANRGFRPWYAGQQHWRRFIAQQALVSSPGRILEFGCNAGRNLQAIRERDPDVTLVGVDINAEAVAWGHDKYGLDLRHTDENWLAEQQDDAFDVAFTVSVLDHLPDPEPVLAQLQRVAPRVLLLELFTGSEGRVEKSPGDEGLVDATPYSYSWEGMIPLSQGMCYTTWHGQSRFFPLSRALRASFRSFSRTSLGNKRRKA